MLQFRFFSLGITLFLFVHRLLAGALRTALADVTIVQDGKPAATIYVPAEVMSMEDKPVNTLKNPEKRDEGFRITLRESVKDLALYLEKISGAKVEIVEGAPQADSQGVPILIGDLATEAFGQPGKTYPYQQGFRIVVGDKGIGLLGESDLAVSYAIYQILDELGCRWYMPSEMGEVIPSMKTITLADRDDSMTPGTIYRGIWYADDDYKRRNRCGGLLLSAGHALEYYVSKEDREKHPEIQATINGQPNKMRLKWSHPLTAKLITEEILKRNEENPQYSFSLSPEDGAAFDESEGDKAWDAGDFDKVNGTISYTDRLIKLCNIIAGNVTEKEPDMVFGMLAYANYIRPPVREKLHPSIVPQLAPIAYNRYHPITDDNVPGVEDYRLMVEGWGKASQSGATSVYFYAFNLAEAGAPFPMIKKWSVDIPVVYKHGCKYWQPETMPNFDTTFHALNLGLRMAWDPTRKPEEILAELNEKFYGNAAQEMTNYWNHIDHVWTSVPEYSGSGLYFIKRWTPEALTTARSYMNEGLAAAKTPAEKFRVELANQSLKQLETFVKLREDLAAGRYEKLGEEGNAYQQRHIELGEKYEDQFCFSRVRWTPLTVAGLYYKAFYKATYEDASRVASEFNILTEPMRDWKIKADEELKGEEAGFAKPEFADADWQKADPCLDSWSALGFHDYFGSMWYRTNVKLPTAKKDKKTYLWIGSTDGRVKVFVNGKHIPYVNDKGETVDTFEGFCKPASFDITSALNPDGNNQISLLTTRTFFNELGTGGLLSQTLVYQEK